MSSGSHYNAFRSETFTMVKILDVLGDHMQWRSQDFGSRGEDFFFDK
jgi:hypothetical protein